MSLLAVLIFGLSLSVAPVKAAELLMFEEEWCHWCDRWNDEIGVIYNKTTEGKRAPLRRIDIHGTFPDDVELTSRPQFTPTFVLIEGGRELGRIEGYPGEDFFWGLLGRLLDRLPEEDTSAAPAPDLATN
ncbi:MAG: hypothetical protein AB8B85_05310 [Paracoccaceae bacterium]